MLLAHNILSFALAYTVMSFIEYATHRWMLHMNTVSKLFPQTEFIKERLRDHAVSHHSIFYKCFRKEVHPEGKHIGLFIPLSFYIYIGIITFALFFIDWISALYLLGVIVTHYIVWNKFHEIMHFDTQPWYLRVPGVGWWFRLVEYYHFLHHQHRNKNFNAFLPLWDFLLGTLARETQVDRDVWRLVNAGEFVDRRGQPMLETSEA